MPRLSRSFAEQETIIRWDRASSDAEIWTAAEHVKNRLQKRGWTVEVSGGGWKVVLPQKAVSIRSLRGVQAPKRAFQGTARHAIAPQG